MFSFARISHYTVTTNMWLAYIDMIVFTTGYQYS